MHKKIFEESPDLLQKVIHTHIASSSPHSHSLALQSLCCGMRATTCNSLDNGNRGQDIFSVTAAVASFKDCRGMGDKKGLVQTVCTYSVLEFGNFHKISTVTPTSAWHAV